MTFRIPYCSWRLLTIYSDIYTKERHNLRLKVSSFKAEAENADLAEYKLKTKKEPKFPRSSCRYVMSFFFFLQK